MLQFLPKAPERARVPDLDPGDAPEGVTPHVVAEDDAWVEGRSLIETVEDLELIDPAVSSEQLVYRLFHEPGVRVFNSVDVRAECSCSRGNVEAMLKSFSQDDRDHMVENGMISVTCEFCSANYVFEPADVAADPAAQDDDGRRRRDPGPQSAGAWRLGPPPRRCLRLPLSRPCRLPCRRRPVPRRSPTRRASCW